MANDFKNVRRIQATTRSNLSTELKTKQLGFDSTTKALGFKSSAGDMSFYSPEGGDASFNSLAITEFVGNTGNLSINASGEVIITNALESNAVTASTGAVKWTNGITINTDTTKFDVGALVAYFSDSTDPLAPLITLREFEASTANAVTSMAGTATYVGINIDGTLIQQGSPFVPDQTRSIIPLGIVVHTNHTNINAVNNSIHVASSPSNQLADLIDSLGAFVINGNKITPNGPNLYLDKSAGDIFKCGSNFVNNVNNPHTLYLEGLVSPSTLRYRTQLGLETPNTSSVIPATYDLSGVLTPVPNNKWTIQRIYLFSSNLIRIQYGQHLYDSQEEALGAVNTESFVVESNIAANGIHIGVLVVKQDATELSNPAQATFINVGKFGTTMVGGGSSGGSSTLQETYNNSTTPEIITNNSLGALSLANGQTLDTANQLEIKRLAGDITASIDGNGEIRVNNYNSEGYNPLMTAKMGVDPLYPPYIYFGADDGTTSRKGMSIGTGALSITSDTAADLTILKKVTNGANSIIHMSQDEKIYHSTQSNLLSWNGDGRHNFWGSVGITKLAGAGNTDIVLDPADGKGVDINSTQYFTKKGYQWANEFNGMVSVKYTYDHGWQGFVIMSSDANEWWINGIRKTALLGNTTVIHGTDIGIYFIYINSSNVLTCNTVNVPWDLRANIVPLMAVYYTGTASIPLFECHNHKRDRSWHSNAHTTLGTQAQVDGFDLYDLYPADNSPTTAKLRYGINEGWLKDEDIKIDLSTLASGGTSYNVLYRNTASPLKTLELTTRTVPFSYEPTTYIQYNSVASGTLVTSKNNKFINYFVVACQSKADQNGSVSGVSTAESKRFLFIPGQTEHSSINAARTEEFWSLSLGDLNNFPEWVPLYRITYKTLSSYTNALGLCRVEEYKRYYVSRGSITGLSSSSSSITLPALVTGGLGLIPVGTTSSGHVVFDGSAGAILSYDTTKGLMAESTDSVGIRVRRSDWNVGQQALIGFELQDLANPAQSTLFASCGAEIIDPTDASEDGAFVAKAVTAGIMTEQFRAVGGKLGVGRTPTIYGIEASSIGAIGDGLTVAQLIANSPIGATTLGASVVTSNNVNAVTMASWGSLVVEDTLFGVSKRSRNDLMAEGGILALGTKTAHNIVIGTNNLPAITISGTNQNSTFAGKIIASTTTTRAGINLGGINNVSLANASNGDIFLPDGYVLRYKNGNGAFRDCATLQNANAFESYITVAGYIQASSTRGVYFTGAGAPTLAGEFAHDTTQKSFVGFANGLKGWIPRTLASVYGAVTVSSNASTVCFAGSKIGSNVLAASAMALVGKRYQVKVTGYLNFTVSSPFYTTGWLGTTGGGINIGASTLTIAPTGGNVPFSAVMDVVTTAHSTTSTLNTHIVLKVGGASAQSSTSTASIATTSVPMEILINQDIVTGNSFTITGAYLQELI